MSFRLPPGASALVTLLTLTFVALIPAVSEGGASGAGTAMAVPGGATGDSVADAAAHAPKAAMLAEVSDTEVEEWSRYVELAEGSPSRLSRARKVEEIVILRTLAGRLDARLETGREPSTAAELARREEELAAELAGRRLDQRLGELETPSEAQVRADFAARQESLRHPRLWRLSDIFQAVPRAASQTERDAARLTMEALRARVVAGEAFADLARAESDSSTRERGGAAGFVALEDLRPELARVVSGLEPGDLSPVIELPGGFVLLLCGGIDPEREADLDEERAGIVERLRAERVRARRAALEAEIAAGIPSTPGAPPLAAPGPSRSARLDAEARRLGWTPDADDRILTHWQGLALRAQLAADLAVAERIVEPTAAEIAAAWAAPGAGWIESRQRHLRALTLAIDRGRAASTYESFLAAGRELAAGAPQARALERTQEAVAPLARLEELGWLTDDEVWALGRNADTAIRALAVGRLSPAVQEGRSLRIFELLGERPERRKTLAEATPEIRSALVAERRRRAIVALRQEILQSAGVATVLPAPDAPGGKP